MFASIHKNLKETGATLIELLIALMLGLILIGLILEMYVANQTASRLKRALSHLQTNAKTASDILSSGIRKAGTLPCGSFAHDFPVDSTELSVRHAGLSSVLLHKMTEDQKVLYASAEIKFSSGDILIISDCLQVEIFQVKESSIFQGEQKIVLEAPLTKSFSNYAEISTLEINKYIIADTNRKDSEGRFVKALFVEDIKSRKMELVENVHALQINAEKGGVAIHLELISPPLKKRWSLYVAR